MSVKIPHFHRSSRWSVMQQRPRHRSQRSQIRVSGVFVPAVISDCSCYNHRLASCRTERSDLHWQEEFPFWSSAVRVHWDLQHRLRSWSETEWVRRMESCLRQLYLWKKQEKSRLLHWIRQERSQTGNRQVTDMIPAEGISEKRTVDIMPYALEQKSEHPLAKAILAKAEEQ